MFFYELHTRWSASLNPAPELRFAQLLLTPNANTRTLKEFATHGFPEPADLACFILGKEECVGQIQTLASLGDADLRRAGLAVIWLAV